MGSQSFTQPYYDADMGVAATTAGGVKGLADLKGKVIGVLSGSTGEKYANDNKEAQGFSEVKGYDTQQNVLLDLAAGRVDGVISDVRAWNMPSPRCRAWPSSSVSRRASSMA